MIKLGKTGKKHDDILSHSMMKYTSKASNSNEHCSNEVLNVVLYQKFLHILNMQTFLEILYLHAF